VACQARSISILRASWLSYSSARWAAIFSPDYIPNVLSVGYRGLRCSPTAEGSCLSRAGAPIGALRGVLRALRAFRISRMDPLSCVEEWPRSGDQGRFGPVFLASATSRTLRPRTALRTHRAALARCRDVAWLQASVSTPSVNPRAVNITETSTSVVTTGSPGHRRSRASIATSAADLLVIDSRRVRS